MRRSVGANNGCCIVHPLRQCEPFSAQNPRRKLLRFTRWRAEGETGSIDRLVLLWQACWSPIAIKGQVRRRRDGCICGLTESTKKALQNQITQQLWISGQVSEVPSQARPLRKGYFVQRLQNRCMKLEWISIGAVQSSES
jgi:hypothetical protein